MFNLDMSLTSSIISGKFNKLKELSIKERVRAFFLAIRTSLMISYVFRCVLAELLCRTYITLEN